MSYLTYRVIPLQFIRNQAFLDAEAAELLYPEELALMDGSPKMRQVRHTVNINNTAGQPLRGAGVIYCYIYMALILMPSGGTPTYIHRVVLRGSCVSICRSLR